MINTLRLHSPIDQIPGLIPAKCELLKKAFNIFIIHDLIHHYPFRYIDKSKVYTTKEVNENSQYIQLYGKISNLSVIGLGSKRRLTAKFSDKSGEIELVWFQGISYYEKGFDTQASYLIFGKPSKFGNKFNIVHPEIRKALPEDIEKLSGFQPLYPSSEAMKKKGLDSAGILKLMKSVYGLIPQEEFNEFIPSEILVKNGLMNFPSAMKAIHFPETDQEISLATRRIKFDEFFQIQIQMKRLLAYRSLFQKGFVFEKIDRVFDTFYHHCLPYTLTSAQKKVLKEIRKDTLNGKQMNRLLQGDVGSGKTIVALMTMLMAIDNGFQAAIMASV